MLESDRMEEKKNLCEENMVPEAARTTASSNSSSDSTMDGYGREIVLTPLCNSGSEDAEKFVSESSIASIGES